MYFLYSVAGPSSPSSHLQSAPVRNPPSRTSTVESDPLESLFQSDIKSKDMGMLDLFKMAGLLSKFSSEPSLPLSDTSSPASGSGDAAIDTSLFENSELLSQLLANSQQLADTKPMSAMSMDQQCLSSDISSQQSLPLKPTVMPPPSLYSHTVGSPTLKRGSFSQDSAALPSLETSVPQFAGSPPTPHRRPRSPPGLSRRGGGVSPGTPPGYHPFGASGNGSLVNGCSQSNPASPLSMMASGLRLEDSSRRAGLFQ